MHLLESLIQPSPDEVAVDATVNAGAGAAADVSGSKDDAQAGDSAEVEEVQTVEATPTFSAANLRRRDQNRAQ